MNRDKQKALVRQAVLEMGNFLRSPEAKDPNRGLKEFQKSKGANLLRGVYGSEKIMVDDVLNRVFSIYTSRPGEGLVFDPDDIESTVYKTVALNRHKGLLSQKQPNTFNFPGVAASSNLESSKLSSSNFFNITNNPSSSLPQSQKGAPSAPSTSSLYSKGNLVRPDSPLPKSRYGPEDLITRPMGGLSFRDLFGGTRKPSLDPSLGGIAFDAAGSSKPVTPDPLRPGFAVPGSEETNYQSHARGKRKELHGAVGEAAYATEAEDTGKGLAKGLGALAPFLGPAGPIVGGFATLAKVTFGAIGSIRKWGDHLHNANMKFAEYSSAMAGVKARQEVRDILLERERGGRRAEVAEDVAQTKHAWDRAIAPVTDGIANFFGKVFSLTKPLAEGIGAITGGEAHDEANRALDRLEEKVRNHLLQNPNDKGVRDLVAEHRELRQELKEDPNIVGRWLENAAWPEVYGRPAGYQPNSKAAF